ncbi:Aryl-phospho-beta-D-glucosidase BglC, GH1 family [Verrucomicrobium sp. GAS474]|uniref:cellulase family glycosylhydrolase n=1 Tax=Verrucomicrobium sp. GAS474 TaxID=1882831 RepID=UPI0008797140|nr:cellulase family glycosylhydrolase [Verrucomicrobium sp. GAS474]SDU12473.1 Aryl-phospho-beta-D-glucosidase BglC, GH1 family [Verrucomicrobium sp. GAS474]
MGKLSQAWVLALFFCQATAFSSDLSGSYEWSRMKIGGGGFVVGMSFNPGEKDLLYVRTDVAGAYRWNAPTASWKQLVTSASLPPEYVGYGKYAGVDSLVGAPGKPEVAYMAFGGQPYGLVAGQVFRSTDRGDHWQPTRFRETGVKLEPNGEGRLEGERLAVDPANENVVYFASIQDGLWFTEDGGGKWSKVAAVPAGKPPHGVTTILFDKKSGTTQAASGARTNTIYATVEEGGVFRSADAGATWSKISDGAAGDAGKPRDATIGPDGTYYVVYDSVKGGVGSLWKYGPGANPSGAWTEITPPAPNGGKDKSYGAISVDPFDPNHVVAMINGGKTFVSFDQGATWTYHLFRLESPNIEWMGKQANYYLSTGQLAFDPFDKGKIWYAEGFGVWWTRDLSPAQIAWRSESEGIEEVCGNDVIAPPGGKPVAAMWDVGAFYFDDVDLYTARRSQPGFMSAWALDWCARDPKFIAGVFRSHLDFVPKANSSGFSTDGGKTWTRFAALENGTAPKELEYGVIAVSASDPDHLVWSPSAKKLPYYTADRGATWKQATLGGPSETGFNSHPMSTKPLCADRVAPDTFYLYTPQAGLFRSTDGGASFSKAGNPVANKWGPMLKATPGHAGDLWFAAGDEAGLFHSTDGGATWTRLPALRAAANIGLGKAQADDGYPTLYVAGNVAGEWGLFRSVDQGASWDKLVDYPVGIFDAIDAMDGDKDLFGQVYVGFSGSGFAYGKPRAAAAQAAPAGEGLTQAGVTAQMGRGLNLGNFLEAPHEGAYTDGRVLQEDDFALIRKAGFKSIRVPICWVSRLGPAPDYTIDPAFLKRVDWVVAQAKKNDLTVVLDYHNDDALDKQPDANTGRYLATWKQIAEHYKDEPSSVYFELFNEPTPEMGADRWNDILAKALAVVRASNPTRTVVIGPVAWNNINRLPDLVLPLRDRNLLVTVHFYYPMEFTHQGASWVGGSEKWLGTPWLGTEKERQNIVWQFGNAAGWAEERRRPIFVGEFGSFEKGDLASRVRWTAFVARTAASHGFTTAYWEFCSGFGAYDPVAREWRQPLLEALMGE